MAKSVPLPVKGDLVHQGVDSCFIVSRAGNLSLSQTSISHLEVWIQHTIGESSHADPDSFQHTITSQLVHNQGGLNFSWLLVGVGYKATDKVGLTTVEGSHEFSKGDKVD